MEPLFGKTLDELKLIVSELQLPAFTAKQIADWLYKKEVRSIDEFSNLSKVARQRLQERFTFGLTAPIKMQQSADGTRKYLFAVGESNFIETAMIPDDDRVTVCVSSQVGCKMNCRFCMTGKQGFQANLSATEILNQLRSIEEFCRITNIVFMGMGEPMDNLPEVLKALEILTADWGYAMSPKRITVSTVGIVPAMKEFLVNSKCHLAVSLHNPIPDQRAEMMPIQKKYSIQEVIDAIRRHDFGLQRRVSFEYIMFAGLNDTPRHVSALAALLKGIDCRVNLIRFHSIPDSPFQGADEATIQQFKDALNARGVLTTVRASRGEDIQAACGLLSTKELVKKR
ncbi:MAG: 23S rRNA (adenine(2503)-C(2))-methyltransferase RlmN [Salinivirgaceae bacterium]|nr:23S rRNA (adenine(2503)-C(2))-methyltransferase RlmN [Salinivirgaceae bacterium]